MALYAYRHVIANERRCWQLIQRLRWPSGVECPACGHRRVWRMHEAGRCDYRCPACRRHFSVLTGTLLEGTRLPLAKWVLAIALFKIGISARALALELEVSRRIAWRLLHRLREALASDDGLLQQLQGQIEVDDTYVGGRHKGQRGRGAAHKTIVIGLKERGGRVRSLVIPTMATATIQAILKAHVARGARVYTDEFSSYTPMRGLGVRHRRVKHAERFARGQTHTQSIEGHWGHLKPTLVARHRSVSPRHLQKYLIEADAKRNFPKGMDFVAYMLTRLMSYPASLPF